MLDLFNYSFIIRGIEAGIIIAIIAPLIGMFLVLRRYSLIADTLSHVSLAGVAIGVLFKINPLLTAILATISSSIVIEKLRLSKKVYGESALSLFLSGSLALAIVLISFGKGFSVDLFSYLFGSLTTVTQTDLWLIGGIGLLVITTIWALYKELIYVTFDEEAAKVSGLPTKTINILIIMLSALTVAVAIPIIGVLLISALIVIPVIAALQFRKTFKQTLMIAEGISVTSVLAGIIASFYLNLSPGGTIVLITILFFIVSFITNKK